MFTPILLTHSKPVSHLSYCVHIFALVSVCAAACVWVCVPMCMLVCIGQLIPSARKCPAARIWTWESVRCSVDMWHSAKLGLQPLSISLVQYCPFTAKALPESGWECWEKLHFAKNKFEIRQTKPISAKNLPIMLWTVKTIIRKFNWKCWCHACWTLWELIVYCWSTIHKN